MDARARSIGKLSRQTFSPRDAERTAEFYDALHIHYEKVNVFSEQNPYLTSYGLLRDRIISLNLEKKIRNGVVLDAGCGAWQKGVRILRQFNPHRIEAVDFNERSLAHCRQDPQEATTYSKQDLAALSFRENTFDFIICEGVVHHTLDPVRTLDELVRVLNRGGCLTLGVYCWQFPYSAISVILRKTLKRFIRPSKFLSLSGANKIMLIFADFLFVPIEHIINENELLDYFASRDCLVITNAIMWWPLPFLGSWARTFYKVAGLNYRHIFVVKQGKTGGGDRDQEIAA